MCTLLTDYACVCVCFQTQSQQSVGLPVAAPFSLLLYEVLLDIVYFCVEHLEKTLQFTRRGFRT